MKVFGQDIESTGVEKDSLMIEIAFVPLNLKTGVVEEDLLFHRLVKCPSFEELSPNLSEWVRKHNKELIEKAHREGVELLKVKDEFQEYLNSNAINEYFGKDKRVIFGKSLSGIDLPYMDRDFGWDFMRTNFYHQNHDLSTTVMDAIVDGVLPPECISGSKLTKFLLKGKDEVDHRAIADIIDAVKLYTSIRELYKAKMK